MKRLFFMVLGLGLFFCAMTSAAQAQATRTWVSGLGDDANPCSRTAPCKTFPGAYSRTAVGGEIDVIDPGGFGTISIGHSITIDGGGGLMASILATSGTNAVNINAASGDDIILRNLTLQGVSDYAFPGATGISFNSGRQLSVEHCVIENFAQYGIFMNTTAATKLNVRDTTVNHAGTVGVYSKSTSGINVVSFSNSFVYNSGGGVWANQNASIQVSYSTIANNTAGDGLYADPQGGTNSSITSVSSTMAGNFNGAHAVGGGIIRIGGNSIVHNSNFGILSGTGGKVFSWLDNDIAGNGVGDGTPDLPNLSKT